MYLYVQKKNSSVISVCQWNEREFIRLNIFLGVGDKFRAV